MDKNVKYFYNMCAFTLVELIISIFISIILLGGVFYFISDTILGISRVNEQARFLKDFYSFTTVLDSGILSVLRDYTPGEGYDVALLTSIDGTSGVLIGVVDIDTATLSQTGQIDIYHNNVLGYRALSSSEVLTINANPEIAYTYTFFPDKIFPNFGLRDFQLQMYNSGSIMDMYLYINPSYNPQFWGESWSDVPQSELFKYSLNF